MEVVIKQEPEDFNEGELFNAEDFIPIDHVKVEYENDSYGYYSGDVAPSHSSVSSADERLSILDEKPDLITVCASEPMKIEDELNILGQLTPEENLQYTRLENESQSLLKPSLVANFSSKAEENLKQFDCRRNCGRKFKTLTERALHESHEHQNKSRTIKCNFCNKNFDSFFALTRHMPEHRNVHRYVCTHCSKCFESYPLLQSHWKTSAECSSGESAAKDKLTEGLLEEPPKISILKTKTELSSTANNNAISTYPPLASLPQNKTMPKTSLPLELYQIPSTQKKDLSFAEEIKAFAAKYQIKTNIVAKKRTSPMIIMPTNPKKRKKSKDQFEIVSKYAVPNAIGPSNGGISNPIINVKIKEEPLDDEQFPVETANPIGMDEIEVKCEPFCDIPVKNEPIDESQEETIKTYIIQKNTESNSHCISSPNPMFLEHVPLQNEQNQLNFYKITQFEASNSNCFDSQPPSLRLVEAPTVNESAVKTAAMPLKNIKILKLAPNVRIIKLPSMKTASIKKENETLGASINSNEHSDVIPRFVPIKLPFSSAQINDSASTNNITTNLDDAPRIETETDAAIKQEMIEENTASKRRKTMPRTLMRCIESQPQTKKIIEEIQKKIEEVKNTNPIVLPILPTVVPPIPFIPPPEHTTAQEPHKETIETANPQLPVPSSLYLIPTEKRHPELFNARRKYPFYRFSWICPCCTVRYDQKSSFISHLVRQHQISSEECKNLRVEVRPFLCGEYKRMSSLSKLKLEVKQQKEDVVQVVTIVGKKERKPEFLSYAKFRCPHCLRTCSSRSMLNDHIAGNCGRVPMHKCSECPKAFHSANTLNIHKSIHTGALPYKCDFCEKRFRTPGQVRVHHRSHTGEKPFACKICTQKFSHRETLISHLSRHIGMKRYRCYACGKHFSCVSGLKNHHDLRPDTCGRVKLNTRAVGPRVRVIRGEVHFEAQPEINPYLRTEDPQDILTEIQNIQETSS